MSDAALFLVILVVAIGGWMILIDALPHDVLMPKGDEEDED